MIETKVEGSKYMDSIIIETELSDWRTNNCTTLLVIVEMMTGLRFNLISIRTPPSQE